MILSLQLARFGINCMLAERNLDTTKWPKMDCTNCRTMELFKRLGIANGFREIGQSFQKKKKTYTFMPLNVKY